MITIIVTAFKEPNTIGRAIESIESQPLPKHETLVVAPDSETLSEAEKLKPLYSSLRVLRDSGEGKPAALNFAISKSHGETIILTDGDVFVSPRAIENILKPFKDEKVGAVTGRPVSLNSKKNIFGFWARVLTLTADKRRFRAVKTKKRFFVSGYLFAIRKNLFPSLPKELLSEDGYISHKVFEKNYLIKYSRESLVFVKYPTNFKDWIIQKRRSAGGYNQIKSMVGVEIRSFRKELLGAFDPISYSKNLKEFSWVILLFLARLYLWAVIYKDINIKKKSRDEVWLRVASTK